GKFGRCLRGGDREIVGQTDCGVKRMTGAIFGSACDFGLFAGGGQPIGQS
ncbi:MAG: hypothetical protein RIQ99_1876, partial [Pseudomonadota bacterium]